MTHASDALTIDPNQRLQKKGTGARDRTGSRN